MVDERWARVKALFQAAVERPASEREAFLTLAAGDDEALRREVLSLLASDERDAAFLDWVPAAAEAALSIHHRIGAYEIVALVGAGGMGEVYHARDTTLNRDVALKVLPPKFALDPDRLGRFKREAQMLAALKHPNIAAIYGFEESSGVRALVLELIEGPTLADRIALGPIRPDEVVTIGSQIAGALEAAHRKGILHRDLKPANIKFDASGVVKVLDFGLAKPVGSDSAGADPGWTRDGVILGTAAYMSPEQARGRAVDKRTDIWSFGCVLFEMLTGRAAFAAETISDTIARVLSSEADWQALPRTTPARLRDLIRRCLQKDANQRLHDIGDARIELGDALGAQAVPMKASGTGAALAHAPRVRAVAAGLAVIAVLGLAGAAAVLWRSASQERTAPPASKHTQVTFIGAVRDAALSPDGRSMAYVTGEGDHQRLMVQDVSGGQALEIARGQASSPRWSPDGSRLAYIGTGITVVSRLGGSGRVIAYGGLFSWSSDGSRIAVTSWREQAFRVVTLHDGRVQRVALNGFPRLEDLDWDPHADRLAILTFDDRKYQWTIWRVTLDGAAVRLFDSSEARLSSPRWSPDGDAIYFLRKQNAAELLRLSAAGERGAPQVLLSGLQAGGGLTLSADGRRLLHTRGVEYSNLWIASLTGGGRSKPITEGTSAYWTPQVSPDGRWIVTATGAGSNDTIAKLPFDGGDLIPLTFGDSQADNSPVWSADGKRILFTTNRSGAPGVWVMDADGRQQRKLETSEIAPSYLVTWIPGGHIGWQQTTPGNQVNYRIRDLTTGREEFLVKEGSGSIFGPVFSPRDDQVALIWARRERPGLWVFTWPGREGRFLTREFGLPLGWSPDGLWIYALGSSGQDVLRISARTGATEIATTFKTGTIRSGDVTPDGRYVVCSVWEYKGDAWLIENFDPQPRPKAR